MIGMHIGFTFRTQQLLAFVERKEKTDARHDVHMYSIYFFLKTVQLKVFSINLFKSLMVK